MKVVVIGTGAAGLSAAAHLAKAGAEVVALERGKALGGCLNPFVRRKYEFEPGVHYVGQCGPGEAFHRYWEDLGLDAGDMFAELDPDGFDRYRFPDEEMAMCKGLDAYEERLGQRFPHERSGLRKFFRLVHALQSVSDGLAKLGRGRLGASDVFAMRRGIMVAPWMRATYGELLSKTFVDPHLRAILSAMSGNYGLPPSRASAAWALAVLGHYGRGAYFPRGGGRSIRDALVESAKASGATFRRRSPVDAIVVRSGRTVAVRLECGEVIPCDAVISAIDPTRTYRDLLRDVALPSRLRAKVESSEPSLGALQVFLGMRRDLRQHGLGPHNLWLFPKWDLDALYAPLLDGPTGRAPALLLSPNSLKDRSGSLAPPGCSTLEVLTFLPHGIMDRWTGTQSLRRGEEYLAFKQQLTDWVLRSVDAMVPGLVGDVEICETGTPLTSEHYLHAVRGGAYGPAATPKQSLLFRYGARTPIKGLLLAGSGVLFGASVMSALLSGQMAARLALVAARANARAKPPAIALPASAHLRSRP